MKILNKLVDFAINFKTFRTAIRYAFYRSEGLQFGSYDLTDEVDLASYFTTRNPQGAVIDAGANKGDWACNFVAANPVFGKLIVIEPQSYLQATLKKLADINRPIFIEQVAIGSTTGELVLYYSEEGSPLASLYSRDLTHYNEGMKRQEVVKVTTLDEIAKKYDISHIAYLKLDIEGHELEALKGAKNLLDKEAIDVISFEFGGCNIDSRTFIKDFWSFLVNDYEFKFYLLLPKQRLLPLCKYSELLEQFSWQNILAYAPNIQPKCKILE